MQINRYDNRGCFLTVEDPVDTQIDGATQSSVLSGESGGFHSAYANPRCVATRTY